MVFQIVEYPGNRKRNLQGSRNPGDLVVLERHLIRVILRDYTF